ncbi:MAG: Trm112 family protein [Planctomycetaceae bacterium]|nr:Trm112 family protein [Planctomycetaceae bacterium]
MDMFNYEKVKDILVCPKCRGELVYADTMLVCVNPERRWSYPIVDGIPRLLIDEAEQLTPEVWGAVMQKAGRDSVTGQLQKG